MLHIAAFERMPSLACSDLFVCPSQTQNFRSPWWLSSVKCCIASPMWLWLRLQGSQCNRPLPMASLHNRYSTTAHTLLLQGKFRIFRGEILNAVFYIKFNESFQHQQSNDRYDKACILHCEATTFALVVTC